MTRIGRIGFCIFLVLLSVMFWGFPEVSLACLLAAAVVIIFPNKVS